MKKEFTYRTQEQELEERLHRLDEQIAALPKGSVSRKTINGRVYYYHRWQENKKRVEKYVPAGELTALQEQIQNRKYLESARKDLEKQLLQSSTKLREDSHEYAVMIRRGPALRTFSDPVIGFRKRSCYETLRDYVFGPHSEKVFILYGLRRTGKTTMIRQILAEMDNDMLNHTAFFQLSARNTLADVNRDLQMLEKQDCRWVFLDEVTLLEDFIDGAALLSDIFAASGMKIVLSGTDSLGFLFAEDEQLYDRCILLHTTFIPYREFQEVLGIRGIDEYIRYGGTMSLSGMLYNRKSPFAGKEEADSYVDSAIARNIQHSLRNYQQAGHFRHLQDLYEKNELTSAINRIVEDQTHRFTLEVLTKDFKSGDLSLSARNLRRDRTRPNAILDRIDIHSVTDRLKALLEIRNKKEQSVTLQPAHVSEIREYLILLDLIRLIDIVALPEGGKTDRAVISQPGLRYAQARALIQSLLLDPEFTDLSLSERNAVQERILSEIRGRMLEDAVLLETTLACPDKEVFKLQFSIGEFDMVVFDPYAASCRIYEIKHSAVRVPEQTRHLLDAEKCRLTEHRYGEITGKYVIYRGETGQEESVEYINVEEYLCGISRDRHGIPTK